MSEGFRTTRASIARRLEMAKDRGQLPDDLNPGLVAGALLSFYLGARVCKLVDQDLDTDGQLEQMIRVLQQLGPAAAVRESPA